MKIARPPCLLVFLTTDCADCLDVLKDHHFQVSKKSVQSVVHSRVASRSPVTMRLKTRVDSLKLRRSATSRPVMAR